MGRRVKRRAKRSVQPTKRLLSVDFDAFFVNPSEPGAKGDAECLYDWGHNENFSKGLLSVLWVSRAAAFRRRNVPLPMTTGDEGRFWPRFKFSKGAKLWVADSHLVAAVEPSLMRTRWGHIVNVDAHHDAGYGGMLADWLSGKEQYVDCGSWSWVHMGRRATFEVWYPPWMPGALKAQKPVFPCRRRIDDGEPVADVFDGVFVCRSSAWTPPWLDERFDRFVAACPIPESRRVMTQGMGSLYKRTWGKVEETAVEQMVQQEKQMLATLKRPGGA